MLNAPPSARGYAVAVVATAAVGALRLALAPALGDVAPVIPFVLPVILAGWLGGFRHAMLATVLGALLSAYLFVPPYHSLRVIAPAAAVALALFLVCGSCIALVCESLHESRRRLQTQNRMLILEADEREAAQQALRRSEARLRESERAFRLAADTAPSMIWSADPQGVITWANERWFRYCGLTPEENARDWARLVLHPDDYERCVAAWSQTLATGSDYEIEVRNRRHDGVYRWFVSRAVPLRDDHGRVVSWFGSTTDIHQQKEMEQALLHADRRKDEFLATLSHELRNPLAPMGYALDLLQEAGNDPLTIARARTMMERQLLHLVRLVDDLLDISRVTAGKLQLERGPVALSTLVDNAVESSQPQIEAGGQHLEVELPVEPLVIDGDPTRLSQVLTNLLNNAARYTPRGGSIRFAAERRGDEVALRVRDTGIGLAPGQAERIFDLFVQGREAAQSQRGLGEGLALARALVELHGGRIAASSDGPGLGAEVLVHLPLLVTGSVIEAAARAAAPLAPP